MLLRYRDVKKTPVCVDRDIVNRDFGEIDFRGGYQTVKISTGGKEDVEAPEGRRLARRFWAARMAPITRNARMV